MMKLTTLEKLFEDLLKDTYSAENQLLKALPRMAKAATAKPLKDAFTGHLEETRRQVERLSEIGTKLGIKLSGKKCVAMEGLIEEANELLKEDGEAALIDAALIMAAQKVEHYEISAYGSARTLAEHLGYDEVAELLQETLEEESAADEKLTAICVGEVLPAASATSQPEDDDEDDEDEGMDDGEDTEEEEEQVASKAKGKKPQRV